MTPEMVLQLVTSLGIIPTLFVWLLMYIMSENKKDKEDLRKREVILMEHISKSDVLLVEIMKSVERTNGSVNVIQTNIAILREG